MQVYVQICGGSETLDGIWLGQDIVSAAVALWLILISTPVTLLPRYAAIRKARLRNIAIHIAAAVTVLALNTVNNRIARERAEPVIAAVEAFRAKHGVYPARLDELVPAYLATVPRTKYTLALAEFGYARTLGGALLYYVSLPPFGRPTYSFADRTWSYVD